MIESDGARAKGQSPLMGAEWAQRRFMNGREAQGTVLERPDVDE